MYELHVYHPGDAQPCATVKAARAADVVDLITQTLAEHSDCEHVVVMLGAVRLFAVDCAGRRLP